MSNGKTELLSPDPAGIARAADLLSEGQLVGMPTETVYGLAGDAENDMACARIFEAKGRPRFNPLIVHLPSLEAAERLAILNPMARKLAAAFWPGPLTLVLPLRDGHGLSSLVTAGLETVALRLPAHPVMRAVLTAFGRPVAAPSANPSGRISPSTAQHVLSGLDGKIAAVLDGGPCGVGLESTILAPSAHATRLLREGGLPREAIEPLTGPLGTDTTPGKVQAPGQLSSHYAPHTPVRLNCPLTDPEAIRVGFGPGNADLTLSASGDLIEAAAKLFSTLHAADDLACTRQAAEIHIAPIPDQGLGRAINDRLTRAAAPR
jgi:L-threonylcarbamoyladenylate synthase